MGSTTYPSMLEETDVRTPPCFSAFVLGELAAEHAVQPKHHQARRCVKPRDPIKGYIFFSVRYDIVHEHTQGTLTSVQQNDTRDSNSLACYITVKTRTNQNQVSSWGSTVVCNDVFRLFRRAERARRPRRLEHPNDLLRVETVRRARSVGVFFLSSRRALCFPKVTKSLPQKQCCRTGPLARTKISISA